MPEHPAPHPEAPISGRILRLDLAGAVDAERDLAPAAGLIGCDRGDDDFADAMPSRLRRWAASPGAVETPVVAGFQILAIGPPAEIDAHPQTVDAQTIALPGAVLLPGFVNAHTHLDLTDVGPIALQPGDPNEAFGAWLGAIRAHRPADDAAAVQAVRHGVALAEASGVAAVGDIAGSPGPAPRPATVRALVESGMLGVGYLEFFAIGPAEADRLRRLQEAIEQLPNVASDAGCRPGLQPHAPYTVGPGVYTRAVALAAERGLPLSTHLAETLEERRCIADAEGPIRDMLEHLGLAERIDQIFGQGLHPIRHLAPALQAAADAGRPFLAAHVADAPDHTLPILARAGATVAYCARTAAFFGTPDRLGPHRYQAMLDAGIQVCLGADSVASLPPEASDPAAGAFGPLAEARLLYTRDAAQPGELLKMITTTPAAALGLDPADFTLRPGGRPAGLVLVQRSNSSPPSSAVEGVFASSAPPRLIARQIPV